MKKIFFLIFTLLLPMLTRAETFTEVLLEPYKEFLEMGTYEGQDWSSFEVLPKSRYDTFKAAFEHFEKNNGKVIVELGTSRSFTHGGHPGCNKDDVKYWMPNKPENWDWGAGIFTLMAALTLDYMEPEFHTVDLCRNHIERCKLITKNYEDIMHYHVCSSEDFLSKCDFPEGIDLLYLDTGDITPIEPTAELHLREAEIIVERNLVALGGIILIDDVRNQTPKKFGETSDMGKAKYSIPYFLNNGFEMVMDEYQVLLRRIH